MSTLLTDYEFKTEYRSDTDSLLKDFYIPALSRAVCYQRSVGYFTSNALAHAARGLTGLIDAGGRLELIASPHLTDEDIEAISNGYELKDLAKKRLLDNFVLDESALVRRRLESLSWLIAEGRLSVKIACRQDPYGRITRGIYHEKLGVIQDAENNFVAFGGSGNETEGGLVTNFESLPVHKSWYDPENRAKNKSHNFQKLWTDKTNGLKIYDFTEISAELLQPYSPGSRPKCVDEETAEEAQGIIPINSPREEGELRLPDGIKLRDYQSEAINNWIKNGGKGAISLATGTGKTITALAAATKVRVAKKLDCLLVICPYQNLVTQWEDELRKFGVVPILAFRGVNRWSSELNAELGRQRDSDTPLLTVVATFATFATDAFQILLSHFPGKSLLIADEAHHVGAESLHDKLPDQGFPLRMALSATPERHEDDDGTDRILEWFGPILEPRISVGDAINMVPPCLCPYYYKPLLVDLDEAETQRYYEFSARAAALISQGHTISTSPQLARLLHERSTFLATAQSKTDKLRELLQINTNINKTLVYCGAGSLSLDNDEFDTVRHVDHIVDVLSNRLGIRSASYTAETPIPTRKDRLKKLAQGDLQALVAINCLDEGVDIPCIETAIILSSSNNPRQFIQRRGRVLRLYDGKPHATIYDMIVVPSTDSTPTDAERTLMKREITRYLEFAKDAINSTEAEHKILPLQERFGLLHL